MDNESVVVCARNAATSTIRFCDDGSIVVGTDVNDRVRYDTSTSGINIACNSVMRSLTYLFEQQQIYEHGYDIEGNMVTWEQKDNIAIVKHDTEELELQLWKLENDRHHVVRVVIKFGAKTLTVPLKDKHFGVLSEIYDITRIT